MLQGVPSFLPPPNFPNVPEYRQNYRVLNWPPSEMAESRTCHPKKMAESITLVGLGVASSGVCHLLGVASSGLCHFRGWPVHVCFFFGILANNEIRGWQEGWAILYVAPILSSSSNKLKTCLSLCIKAACGLIADSW